MLRVCYYPLYTYIKTSTDPRMTLLYLSSSARKAVCGKHSIPGDVKTVFVSPARVNNDAVHIK